MKFDKIRTGVIGTGAMGGYHANIYNEISNFSAIADINKERGQFLSEKFNVPFFSNYMEMLDKVDAVSIAVPTKFHRSIAEEVINNGINVLIEKPLSDNSKDADSILKLADKKKVTLSVGHIERFNPAFQKAKKIIQSNSLGEARIFSSKRFSSFPKRITDVGVLFDLCIHDIDLVCNLAGSVAKSVYAVGGNFRNKNNDDHIFLKISFEDGKLALCQASWLSSVQVRSLQLFAEYGQIEADLLNKSLNSVTYKASKVANDVLFSGEELKDTNPLRDEICDFLSSIGTNSKPETKGLDGFQAVKIAEAGLISLNENKEVNLFL